MALEKDKSVLEEEVDIILKKKYEFSISKVPVSLTEKELLVLWEEIGVALGKIKRKKKLEKKVLKKKEPGESTILSRLPLIGWMFEGG